MTKPDSASHPIGLKEAIKVWSCIGWLSFGGPAGQIALMHRELVERRRWISEARFLHALNYCMLLPGPEAQQLATYIGWLMHRTWGGVIAGALFVLPGFLAMLLLSWLYVRYAELTLLTALFFGLKAAVLAVVAEAVLRIGRRALKTTFMFALAAAAFIAIHAFDVPFPWIVLTAALIGLLTQRALPMTFPEASEGSDTGGSGFIVDRLHGEGRLAHVRPSTRRAVIVVVTCVTLWAAPVVLAMAILGSGHVLVREAAVFSQAAVVTFGGAYAVLAYVAQRAVQDLLWLEPGEMIDGLALAETTPGPLIMVLQFVGFLAAYRNPAPLDPWLAAVLGAALTTWVTFVPSFLFILLGAPYMEALRRHRGLNAALSCVTAAVVGVVLNLSVWFALHTMFRDVREVSYGPLQIEWPRWSSVEPGALILSAAALIAMLRFRISMGWVLLGCVSAGAAYTFLTGSPVS